MTKARPPAARILDQLQIPYELVEFAPAIRSAAEIARREGVDGSVVYKTLVVQEEPPGRHPLLVMAPATRELDLRRLARSLGVKKLRMATHDEAERLTGLQVGGISAIALRTKGWPVYVDSAALDIEQVLVSAGRRGADLRMSPHDLLFVTGAQPLELG